MKGWEKFALGRQHGRWGVDKRKSYGRVYLLGYEYGALLHYGRTSADKERQREIFAEAKEMGVFAREGGER